MVERYIDEYEDAHLALDRLNDKNARYYTAEEIEAEPVVDGEEEGRNCKSEVRERGIEKMPRRGERH